MNLDIKSEKALYDEVMQKYRKMSDKKLKRIIRILDTGVEGLCMPEFLEFCQYLIALQKENK